MKWQKEVDGKTIVFDTEVSGMEVTGTYNSDPDKTSSIAFSTTIFAGGDGDLIVPEGMWAQFGYMTTNPQRQGLGYMLSYAAAMLAERGNVSTIFVSSGSIGGGGSALIKKLGGVLNMDQEFADKDGNTVKVVGYLIPVDTMKSVSEDGFKDKGWTLKDDRD